MVDDVRGLNETIAWCSWRVDFGESWECFGGMLSRSPSVLLFYGLFLFSLIIRHWLE
jgi:hypothetical protein